MRSGEPSFWLNPLFEDGQLIDELLIRAAEEFWPEAVRATRNALNDSTRAAEILERSVHEVWAKQVENRILNPLKIHSYLRVVFYRMLYRISSRESCVFFYAPDTLRLDRDGTRPTHSDTSGRDPTEPAINLTAQWLRRSHKATAVWDSPNTESRSGPNYIETMIDLDRLLAELSEVESIVLRLSWLEGEDWRYIAKKVGITPGHARVIGHRALRKLKHLAASQKELKSRCQATIMTFPKKKGNSPKGSGKS
ncbi:MAG: sigma factor-like helix-turn-helix DNA-binding protein [Acidobacteriota bacterium]